VHKVPKATALDQMPGAETSVGWALWSKHSADAPRQHAVRVLALIYLVLVLDGVARKYLLPEYSRPLIFLRDPFVIYLYVHALRHSFIKVSAFLMIGLFISILAMVAVFVQFLETGTPLDFAIFGFRQYFVLLPLPFVMVKILRGQDLRRFFHLNLLLISAMAPLMVAQVISPTDSWVNVGLGSSIIFEGLNYGDYIRASGFFTPGGVALFLDLLGAIIVIVTIMPRRERPCSGPFLIVATLAFGVCVAVSGNRGAIVGLLLVGIGTILTVFLTRSRTGLRALLFPFFLIGSALIVSIVLFPAQYEAIYERWIEANYESTGGDFAIFVRAFNEFADFTRIIPTTPLQGEGLGTATNGYLQLYRHAEIMENAENDWSRHIIDLGSIVGICYIGFRVAFTFYLGLVGILAAIRTGDPTAWILFCAGGFTIFNGQISAQSTINGFGWFVAGLILAASKNARVFR
jgi:hypothetical protein